jgi:hypothetical protein
MKWYDYLLVPIVLGHAVGIEAATLAHKVYGRLRGRKLN